MSFLLKLTPDFSGGVDEGSSCVPPTRQLTPRCTAAPDRPCGMAAPTRDGKFCERFHERGNQ